ncbi:MAG: gliding motility-associated C-terminal domain-containing protein [Bacteroidales bacterium]|nr:gliding motility-associated C-terminal domain-containing protein [Bacteroidales bacterium]
MSNNFENIFKNKFENYEQKPNPELWSKIDRKLTKLTVLKISAIVLSVSVFVVLGLVFFPKNQDKTITSPNNTLTEITNNKSVSVVENNNMLVQHSNNKTLKDNVVISNYQKTKVIFAVTNPIFVNISTEDSLVDNKINDAENFNKGFTLSDEEGCSPLTIIVENEATDYKNLVWKINNQEFDNSDKFEVTLDEPGTYEIMLSRDEHGTTNIYKDTVTVLSVPLADFSNPNDLFVSKTVGFENLSQDAEKYSWFVNNLKVSNQYELSYKFDKAGTYKISLIATNSQNCSDTITKEISIVEPEIDIIFPTAFSPSKSGPNGGYYSVYDNQNIVFHPVSNKDISEYKLLIYDRYGKQIFESDDYNIGWDGYYQSKLVEIGVYVYQTQGTFADGKKFSSQGSITVIYNK